MCRDLLKLGVLAATKSSTLEKFLAIQWLIRAAVCQPKSCWLESDLGKQIIHFQLFARQLFRSSRYKIPNVKGVPCDVAALDRDVCATRLPVYFDWRTRSTSLKLYFDLVFGAIKRASMSADEYRNDREAH